jgi:predicted nucleotidyltransferase
VSSFINQRNDRAEQDIRQDIELVVAGIDKLGIGYDAVYLIGSFGRGEGSVRFDEARWRGVNDYDFLIVLSQQSDDPMSLKLLGSKLAKTLEIDFVDLGCLSRVSLRSLPPTIQNYDLKYASLLIAGRDIREEIPNFNRADIPAFEFARLLCNRTAGLLTAGLPARRRSSDYCTNQFLKACVAVGDAAVYLNRGYHPLCSQRLNWFRALVKDRNIPFPLSRLAVDHIEMSYECKVRYRPKTPFQVDKALMRDMIESAFVAIAERCVGRSVKSIRQAERELVNQYCRHERFVKRVVEAVRAWQPSERRRAGTLKNRILFSLPGFYCYQFESGVRVGFEFIRRFWFVPGALGKGLNPLSAVMLWEKYCH